MPAVAGTGGEKPILKVGLITDTHIKNDKASCDRVGMAWRLFKSEGVDMVANLGDIADHNYPKGYEGYRETVDEVWPQGPDHPASPPTNLYMQGGTGSRGRLAIPFPAPPAS